MKKTLFIVVALLAFAHIALGQSVAGKWKGTLHFPTGKLRIVINIQNQNGAWSGTLESPDQGGGEIPLPEVSMQGDSLFFAAPDLQGLRFAGLYDGKQINGRFEQKNYFTSQVEHQELILERADKAEVGRHTQEPQAPLPYVSRDVEIENRAAKLSLSGTLTLPAAKGASPAKAGYPAVVLVTGSGPQNRDEEIVGHKPFSVLADYLTQQGFAVLRYDDRGVGASGGVFAGATTFDFVSDASAAIAYLRSQPEIDTKRIAILGHSEGGLIAQMIAAKDHKIAAIAMLGGPALRGDSILLLQSVAISRASGMPQSLIQKNTETNKKLYNILTDKALDSVQMAQRVAVVMSQAIDEQHVSADMRQRIIESMVAQCSDRWFQTYLGIDPAVYQRQITCPVLALYGGKDLQVLAVENASALKRNLSQETLRRSVIKTFPSLNHLFQNAQTGLPAEYSTIDETISPEVLSFISEELHKALRVKAQPHQIHSN